MPVMSARKTFSVSAALTANTYATLGPLSDELGEYLSPGGIIVFNVALAGSAGALNSLIYDRLASPGGTWLPVLTDADWDAASSRLRWSYQTIKPYEVAVGEASGANIFVVGDLDGRFRARTAASGTTVTITGTVGVIGS